MQTILSKLSILLLVLSLPALVGCDKVRTVAKKLRELEKSDPETTATIVAADYRSDQVSVLTQAGYADFIARKDALVIVDFHAEWCPPCKLLGPVLAKAAEAHPGVVYVGKVNVDQAGELAQENSVRSIPDVRIFKDGREVDRFVGFPGEQAVLAKVAELSQGIQPPPAAGVAASDAPPEPVIQPFDKDWMPPGMSRK